MPKKILFICSLYSPHVGGIETFIQEFSVGLRSRGIDSVVLTKKWPTSLPERDELDGVPIIRVKSFKNVDEGREVFKYVDAIDPEIRADVIHVVGMRRSLPILALYLARKWNVPLVVSFAGGEIAANPGKDREADNVWEESKEMAGIVARNADWNVTFSEDLARAVNEKVPGLAKTNVIHAGIPFNEIANAKPMPYAADRRILFSLRRLVWSKGVDLSIECFNRIKDDFPDIDLVIAGDGDQKEALEHRVAELGIGNRVRFLGPISLGEAYRWLHASYVTLVPSRSEGGGIVNIEAGACGCPVIGSKASGIAEYTIENKTSLLFEIGNLDEFEKKLRQVLSSEALRSEMSKASIEFARTFDWEAITSAYIDQYSQLAVNRTAKQLYMPKEFSYSVLFTP